MTNKFIIIEDDTVLEKETGWISSIFEREEKIKTCKGFLKKPTITTKISYYFEGGDKNHRWEMPEDNKVKLQEIWQKAINKLND